MGIANLEAMFELADKTDLNEGLVAYERYHAVMRGLSVKYQVPLDRVVAVFCALSPNNDYQGNLRSTVSVLSAYREGRYVETVQVSTYRHQDLFLSPDDVWKTYRDPETIIPFPSRIARPTVTVVHEDQLSLV